MPAGFENCVKRGGKVRTVSGPDKSHGLKAGQYCRYCIIDGKSYRGEVKMSAKANRAKARKRT